MSTGMNMTTGRAVSGFAHVQQSVGKIMSTALKSRVMRRNFGSRLPRLVDAPISPLTLVDFYAAVASALAFEPRFRASKIALDGVAQDGEITIAVTGTYYPRALAGDFTGGVTVKAVAAI
jgi:phage baseplate assembly protein W